MSIFEGGCTALITPFTKTNKVNYKCFKKIIDKQIDSGINALLFLGTTGEPSTLTKYEKIDIVKFAVEYVNNRVPVVIGAGTNNTDTTIENSLCYESLGADALLLVTPYYNKCTQNGLINHFEKVASKVNLPIILYNVPSRTGVNMLPQTVHELSKIHNIVAIKEASGNMEQIMQIRNICDNKFDIYSGDDSLIVPILAVGGKGVISVASNVIPFEICSMCNNFLKGNLEMAKNIQLKYFNLIKLLFSEVNPIPIKTALKLIGCDVGELRLPLTSMDKKLKIKLKDELNKLMLI